MGYIFVIISYFYLLVYGFWTLATTQALIIQGLLKCLGSLGGLSYVKWESVGNKGEGLQMIGELKVTYTKKGSPTWKGLGPAGTGGSEDTGRLVSL